LKKIRIRELLIYSLLIFLGISALISGIILIQRENERNYIRDNTIFIEGEITRMRIEAGVSNMYIVELNNTIEVSLGDVIGKMRYRYSTRNVYYKLSVGDYIIVFESGRFEKTTKS